MNKNHHISANGKKQRKHPFHRASALEVSCPSVDAFEQRIKELEEIKEAGALCSVELPFDFDL